MGELTSKTDGNVISRIPAHRVPLAKALGLKLVLIGAAISASALFSSTWWNASAVRDLAAEAHADLENRNFKPLSGSLDSLLSDPTYKPIPTQAHKLLGKPVKDFTLKDCYGSDWSLSNALKKGPVMLVFYYGYQCNHCVSQLFGLAKDLDSFTEFGATIVAISPDPAETTRDRYRRYGAFPFTVVSDPDHRIATQFGTYTPSTDPGEEGDLLHGTFLLAADARMLWANIGPEPFTENRTLLSQLYRSRIAMRAK